MGKLYLLPCLACVLLTSCKQNPQKQDPISVVAEQKIDSVKLNDTIAIPITKTDITSPNAVIHDDEDNEWDNFKRDTVVGNFRIRHAIIKNNKLIPEINFDEDTPIYYRDTDVEIEVEYNAKEIFHKVLSKDDFKEFFIKESISNFQIVYISVIGIENEVLSVDVSMNVPDTDNVRIFYLKISSNGGLTIEESDYEDFYEDEETIMAEINKVLAEVKEIDSLERANSIQMEHAIHNDTLKVDSIAIGN